MQKKTKPPLECRGRSCEVRTQENDGGTSMIVGRPIVYSSPTDIGGYFEEIIEPGALAGADLRDVCFLVNHDFGKLPLARARKGSKLSTMQLTPDDKGLNIEVELDTENNTEAATLYSAVKRGDVNGMSFRFSVKRERWDNLQSDYPTRHIEQIAAVTEVSAVTFPAYEATEINARGSAPEDARGTLESARQRESAGTLDGGALELEKQKILNMYR